MKRNTSSSNERNKMINSKKVLAIIPARGGSKGLSEEKRVYQKYFYSDIM